ncbi:MAG: ArnT family glycosyltransferase [Limnohabitans sp.]
MRKQEHASVWFWRLFWGTLALKLVLAAVFPLTGDEALFVQWGKRPDWGYYDHPPMIGWWLSLVMVLGDARWLIRLLTVLTTQLVALGVVDILMRRGTQAPTPWLAGSIYLLLPWTWMFFLVTTDTPVILFMALAAWCFLRGLEHDRLPWFWAAGSALGLAFLSKYFAVLMGMAFATVIVLQQRQRIWRLLAVALPGLVCAAYNLGFNATHGWPNIMFNLFARQNEGHWSGQSPGVYLLMMAYLLTPWLVWKSIRPGDAMLQASDTRPSRTLLLLWAVPLSLFALVSLRREIGLHWVLGFVPFFIAWSAERLSPRYLQKAVRYTLLLSAPHLLLVLALMAWPVTAIKSVHFREKVVFFRHAPEITRQVAASLPPGALLMGTSYSTASILAYSHGQYVPVFGMGSKYARQDDLWTDFRTLQGRTLRIFHRDAPNTAELAPFFERVEPGKIEYQGASYFFVDGHGFRYDAYRAQVLDKIHQKYFQIPAILPILGNPFCERYGYEDCSAGRHSH